MSAGELLLTLVNRSLAACWLILAIVLLRPFLRRVSPSITCALWGLVAIRLLCPFTVESILSLIPSSEPIPTEAVLSQTQIPAGSPVAGGGGTVIDPAGGVSLPSAPLPAGASAASGEPLWMRVAVTVWIVGIVVFAVYLLVSYLRLHLHAREAVRQEGGYWLCDKISSPFVLGAFRPRILLPYMANAEDIPYILAHERAHLARCDHWRKPIGFVLLAVFWFQPFLWLAYFLLCRDIEFACDERALRTLGTDAQNKKCYANALLHGGSPRMSVIACPVAFGGVQIKRRVKSVLRYRKPAILLIIVALLVCAVVAVCFLSDPVSGGTEETSSGPSESSESSADSLPYDPVQRLEELKERDQWGSTNGFFYLEGVLAGEIDPTAPKLDEETARRIIASYGTQPENFEKIMEAFAVIQLYPDWTGGSGFALAEYWFDDMGDEGLFINLTTRNIFYYVTAPDGSQLPELQEELFPCGS